MDTFLDSTELLFFSGVVRGFELFFDFGPS